jgi:hypothetical protein
LSSGDVDSFGIPVQRQLDLRTVELGIIVVARLQPAGGEFNRKFRRHRHTRPRREPVLHVSGPRVDFVVGPLAGIEVRLRPEQLDALQVDFTAQGIEGIDRSFGFVLGVIDKVRRAGRLEQGPAGHRQPHIGLRRDREREVRFRIAVGVEHVSVNAQLPQLQSWIGVKGTEAHVRVLADVVYRRRPR